MLVTMLGLIAAVALVVLLGDRVGMQPVGFQPSGSASSTAEIIIRFNEDVAWGENAAPLRIEPPIAGEYRFTRRALSFRPTAPLPPGSTYSVTLLRGLRSASGRELLTDHHYTFSVRQPRVAFIAPADARQRNIWIATPAEPDSARQVTFSADAVYDFDVSPDGASIVYAMPTPQTGTHDLYLLDLASGESRQLTSCLDADCTTPAWSPAGGVIAYQRVELNTALGLGASPTRIWLLELDSAQPTTRPLFSDTQIIGYGPQWSADGTRLAFTSTGTANPGIFVFDFSVSDPERALLFIPSQYGGSSTALSPDGTQVIFPELIRKGDQWYPYLRIADLTIPDIQALTSPEEPTDDGVAVWHPDGQRVAIGRKYLDNRNTIGYQIFLLDPAAGTMTPLVIDPRYANGMFSWDAAGTQLVIQRSQLLLEDGSRNPNNRPEIWTYNMNNNTLTLVYVNGMLPQWLP